MTTRLKVWTLKELHSLPDDGNKYELVRGELLVTPPPPDEHETIAARLTRLLDPFVAANELGFIYRPRAVVQSPYQWRTSLVNERYFLAASSFT